MHLDGSEIPDAAWQSSLNSIAQGQRVSLVTADGQTYDINASDLTLEYSRRSSEQQTGVPLLQAQQQQQRQVVPQQHHQPQLVTIIQEDGTQQTINVLQVRRSTPFPTIVLSRFLLIFLPTPILLK